MRASKLENGRHPRPGFTLIEVLMVVAIIGILVGLLVPAVNFARKTVQKQAIAFEVQTLANAVEQYKNKFGDYPPDGSNRATFERHFRKAFPNIAGTEFTALYGVANASNGLNAGATVMDPPEALVFCLGGFSDSPTNPFTGPGGPLTLVPGTTSLQYNVDRNNPLFEFKQQNLTIEVSGNATVSVDEALLFNGTNDLLPVYLSGSGRQAPYVYFDSRTYSFAAGGSTFFNFYNPSNVSGLARPYKSDEVNTAVSYTSAPDAYYRYMNPRSFQIISAGLDDSYGGVPGLPNNNTPTFFAYPSGNAMSILIPPGDPQLGGNRYVEQTGQPSAQLDNAANFADGVLEDALPN